MDENENVQLDSQSKDYVEYTLYKDIIRDSVFQGEYPFHAIIDGLQLQFKDYIELVDTTNYVAAYYDQMKLSRSIIKDDLEDHPVEKKEVLDELETQFLDTITTLFQERLAISVNDSYVTLESFEAEVIIRRLYEFFILSATNNFLNVFGTDILSKLNGEKLDDEQFYARVDERLNGLSGIIIDIHTRDFLEWCENSDDVIEMFEDSRVVGNFLSKYSAKLYQNELFKSSLVSYIVMREQWKQDIGEVW